MASGINKLMNFLKLTDEDDEFDDDFYDDDDLYDQRELEREEKRLQREQKKQDRRSPVAAAPRSNADYFDDEPPAPAAPKRNTYRTTSTGKVVQMPSAASTEMEVCIVRPANIGESQQVCELLINSHPVIVNLEGIDIMEAQRIMDFIAGCIFAISGNMCQISRYIFIFSPKGVDISGDYLKSLTEEESFNMANFHREF